MIGAERTARQPGPGGTGQRPGPGPHAALVALDPDAHVWGTGRMPMVSEVAIRVLDGTQSVSTQAPPSPSASTTVTRAPSCAATRAAS